MPNGKRGGKALAQSVLSERTCVNKAALMSLDAWRFSNARLPTAYKPQQTERAVLIDNFCTRPCRL